MLCDVCKCNDASVFLTQILEGKMQKVNLCDACSKEKGVQDPTGFALADLLLGIGAAEEIEKGAPAQKCQVCGFTQADFKKTGRLGMQRLLSDVCRRPRNPCSRPCTKGPSMSANYRTAPLVKSRSVTRCGC